MTENWDNKIELIARKLAYELTEAEELHFQEWLAEDINHRALFEEIKKINFRSKELHVPFEPDVEQALQKVKSHCRTLPFFSNSLWKYAAVLLLSLGIGVYCYDRLSCDSERVISENIHTGVKQAVLHLASGEQIKLGKVENDTYLKCTGESDIWLDSNQILRYRSTGKEGEEERKNVLEVPMGGEYQLTLSDGTRIWLNSASKLTYPEIFKGKERKVELSGEAFFEVSSDTTFPFIVETRGMEVKVVGTTFNVKAYQDESVCYTTLVKGKVEVSSETFGDTYVLEPGEQALADGKGMQKRRVNIQPYVSWIEGKFVFINSSLEDICRQISRWYDVEILFADEEIRKVCFTGAMMKFRPLEELLEMIEDTSQVKFKRQGRVLMLSQ